LNKHPTTQAEFEEWLERENTWTKETLNILKAGGCTKREIRHVHTLGLIPMYGLSPNTSINHQLNMVVVRCGRIADIAAKYGDE
jgi:hypothetical protein